MTQLDDVKSRLDIVELVGGYVQLQRAGSSFKANCPFHQERTPSFFVFPDRQSWRCFGACAEGGDAFSFVMKADRVDFREALVRLGARVGITITDQVETGGRSQLLFEINDAARQFFQRVLAEPEAAFVREYLRGRGLDDRSLQTFEFGYSPARDNRLLAHLTNAGYEPQTIAEAGLARETEDGRFYDLFRGRLMIPIRDWSARVAGFGSRALDDNATPKYLNTPRTPVFDKSRILYAMHLAKEPVRQHGAVIVEGYMDAVMAHQHGFDNVVASMGTALTEHQVALVRRLTHRVTMALDGDPAGRNATLRSLESSWGVFQERDQRSANQTGTSVLQQPEALDLRVAELPPGKDPDDFIRHSPNEWTGFIESAAPLFDYLLAALTERVDVTSADGRSWAAQTMLRFVAHVPDPIKRDFYLDALAAHFGVDVATLRAAMPMAARQGGAGRRNNRAPATADEATTLPDHHGNAAEELVLKILLQHPDQFGEETVKSVRPEWFARSENREILRYVISLMEPNANDGDSVAPELEQHFQHLLDSDPVLSTPSKVEGALKQACLRLKREHSINQNSQLAIAMADEDLEDPDSTIASLWLESKNSLREIDLLRQPASPHNR
ncbi:MAG: DNA primase [Chloroflexota bacterium]|nr:DNA primase [Chloroflexota bacterium]MDE2960459.1 DNA primase [Chloroflexota bacterium]